MAWDKDEGGSPVEAVRYNTKEHNRLLHEVDEQLRVAADAKHTREDLARRAYKHFRSWMDDAAYPFPTKIYEPKLFSDIMTQVAREIDALSQNPPLLRYHPRGGSNQAQASAMSLAVAYYLEQMPVWQMLVDALLQRRLFGTVYLQTFWRTQTRWMGAWQRTQEPVVDPMTGLPMLDPATGQALTVEGWAYEEGERVTYDGPWFSVEHFCDCFPDHTQARIEDGDFFIVRRMRDKRYLRQQARRGIWDQGMIRRILDKSHGCSAPFSDRMGQRLQSTLEWQEEIGFTNQVGWNAITSRQWFEEVTRWGADGWVTTIINGSYVVRRRRNPFAHGQIPFLKACNYHLPGEHFGMSDFEVGERLYTALTDMRNAGATQAMWSVFPPIKASATVNQRQLQQRSIRDIWVVDGPDDVIDFVELPQGGLQIAEQMQVSFRRSLDDSLGVTEAYRGGSSGGASATGITTAMAAAGIRLGFMLTGFGEQVLVGLGDHIQHMIRQLQSKDITARVTGDPQAEPVTISVSEMRDADFICSPTYSTSQARILEEKRVLEFYELVSRGNNPHVDLRGAYTALVETLLPKRKESMLRSEEDVAREQLAQQMAMQEQEQQKMAAQMGKFSQAQQMAAQMGREADQREAILRGAEAQGRVATEISPARVPITDPAMEELSSELGELTEQYLG